MSLLGKVLAGVGGYLVEQGKFQQEVALEQMKADILANRELALKQVDAQIAEKHDATENAAADERIDRTGAQQQQNDLLQGVIATRKAAAEAAQKHAYDQQDIILKGNIDAKLEQMRVKGQLTEDQYRQALSDQSDYKKQGNTIGHVVVSPLGEVAFFNQHGDLMSQTRPGTTTPPTAGSSSDEGIPGLPGSGQPSPDSPDTLNARNRATGGGIAPTGLDTAAPAPDDPAAKAAFGVRYNAATPATAPNLFRNGQKIPIQEAWQMYSGQ